MWKKYMTMALAGVLAISVTGCSLLGSLSGSTEIETDAAAAATEAAVVQTSYELPAETAETTQAAGSAQSSGDTAVTLDNLVSGGALDTSDLFSTRDLTQTADLSEAVTLTLTSGQDVTVSTEGVYVLSGSVTNVTVIVEAGDEDKVQLVLDGVSITNDERPAIYVKNADKVFITTTDSENSLSVTGSFTADGTTNTDAVIFSRDDLVLGGVGTLNISSTDNGISGKDDVKLTGGSVSISSVSDGIEANESICIAGGNLTISAQKDGLHAENDEDNSTGFVYICGGSLSVKAGDDGIHATTIVQIDGGSIDLTAAEGIEATWVQLNDGSVTIAASDDGINGARKSSVYTPTVEICGGSLTITMGQGDTDAVDSNGNLIITGGTIDITGQSPFDYDGSVSYTGGTIIVNGQEVNQITNQMMGGGMGGMNGGMGGFGGGRRP